MNRRGISGVLLMVAGLVPLALIINFALLYVSIQNAMEYVVAIDVPIFAAIGAVVFISRRRARAVEQAKPPPPTVMDRLKERNGGLRAPGSIPSGRLPIQEAEEQEAEVFYEGTQKSSQQVDEILQRMKAKEMDLEVSPITEVEAKEQLAVEPEPSEEQQMAKPTAETTATPPPVPKFDPKTKNYSLSPDKLKAPAFICPCGHAHRFVCLTCGLTVEEAAKKSKTHWVEWVPEMGAMP